MSLFCLLLPFDTNIAFAAGVEGENQTVDQNENEEKKTVDEFFKENNEDQESKEDNTEAESPLLNTDTNQAAVDSQFTVFDFFNLIFALFLVFMLLYVTLRFIKKRNQTYDPTKTMINLGGTSLGNNRSVQLVKVGERILVLGVGESIQLLKEIESEDEIKQIINQQQNDVQHLLQSGDIFTKVIQQLKSRKNEQRESDSSFKSILSSQLSELASGRKKLLEELKEKGNKSND